MIVPFALGGCGSSDGSGASTDPVTADNCIVELHGKGGNGSAPTLLAEVALLRPEGPDPGWDGRQWIYADRESYRAAVQVIEDAVDQAGCQRVVVHGFSNGASMAAKMYCAGEVLDGRTVGFIVDDPVPDESSAGCGRTGEARVALYWTTALEEAAPAGTRCRDLDWTCEGATTRSIEAYAKDLGTEVLPSVSSEHRQHPDPPEVTAWLPAG